MTRDEALKLLRGGPPGITEWNRFRGPPGEFVELCGVCLDDCDLRAAIGKGVNLGRCDLSSATLRRANLSNAFLQSCRFSGATLEGAILDDSDATGADFTATDLRGASLRRAVLYWAKFFGSHVSGLRLNDARFGATTFVLQQPSDILGLDDVKHLGPSWISVSTLLAFRDDLPENFLRGCGLRDEEIAYFRSVVGKPIRFYSCFISYSTKDEEFASRLHNDFQAKGIRCWKWDHDARTGRSIWGEIDQAIRIHDKVVLIASESSLKSPAVCGEIERAIQEEHRRIKDKHSGKFDGDVDVLFPVRVDDYLLDVWEHERKADVVKKVIADARGWEKDAAVYARVRDRLIKDLKPI